jgi:hypothetical protein
LTTETNEGFKSLKFDNNYVYAWGRNKDGELSMKNSKFINTPLPPRGMKNIYVK